jgi:hypothetical protein
MVKVYGPALSVDASGTLANTMVFSKWKGRNYVRSHVNPAQPRTGAQVGVRAMFKFLSQQWASMTTGNKATWLALAKQHNVSEFNASTSFNQKRWRNYLCPTEASPPALASTAPSAPTLAVTAGVRQLTVAITHGATAPSWGYLIARYLVTGGTPAFSNTIAVIPIVSGGSASFVDTPLKSGTYFYKVTGFNTDAVMGTASTEATGTVA